MKKATSNVEMINKRYNKNNKKQNNSNYLTGLGACAMCVFQEENIDTWKDFFEKIEKMEESSSKWVYRGQYCDWPLKTTLERAFEDYRLDTKKVVEIEESMIRDFRRRYHGKDRDLIMSDTLYCLSVMQHHGAPTRLLDFNYSPYVALFFSLETGIKDKSPVVWCINSTWCREQAEQSVNKDCIGARNKERDEKSFKELYMQCNKKFVFLENAFSLNKRLIIQQGVFLCPGDVSVPLKENLTTLTGCQKKENIIKFKIKFNEKESEYKKALENLHRMNINHDSLFPGLDGSAKSLKTKMTIYEKISRLS